MESEINGITKDVEINTTGSAVYHMAIKNTEQTIYGYPVSEIVLFAEAAKREMITIRELHDSAKMVKLGYNMAQSEINEFVQKNMKHNG